MKYKFLRLITKTLKLIHKKGDALRVAFLLFQLFILSLQKNKSAMDIEEIRECVRRSRLKFTEHCLKRMELRGICKDDVKNCILSGEIIMEYEYDTPFPSCLVFGYSRDKKVLHAVVAFDGENMYAHSITTYYPDLDKFNEDLKTRR